MSVPDRPRFLPKILHCDFQSPRKQFSRRRLSRMEALGPDSDLPAPGNQFAQFAAGCFWGVELAFQRIHGVTNTEVGYSQGTLPNPTYPDVCQGKTDHAETVRVQYDPNQCAYESLLDLFWSRHDPTSLSRQVPPLSFLFFFTYLYIFLRVCPLEFGIFEGL